MFKLIIFLTGVSGFLLAGSDGPFFPIINIVGGLMMAGALILFEEAQRNGY